MDFHAQLKRDDLPQVDYPFVPGARRLLDRLLGGYLRLFNKRLAPMKPIAMVNGMPAYDLTQPPMGSQPGARVLRVGFDYVVRRKPARPISLVLMVNGRCDMSCRHCSARDYMRDGRPVMEFEEIIDLLDQFLALGGASVASVMTEAEGRLSRLSSSEFGPLELLGDGKFRALLVGNRLPMAANEIFAPLFACLPKPFERGGAVVNLSAAIGVALFPTHCASGEEFCVMPRQRSMPPWRNSRTAFAFIPAIWNRARPSATTGRRPSFALSRRMTSKCAIASRSIAGRNAPPVFFASRHGTTPSAAWCRFSITRP